MVILLALTTVSWAVGWPVWISGALTGLTCLVFGYKAGSSQASQPEPVSGPPGTLTVLRSSGGDVFEGEWVPPSGDIA